MAVIGSTAWSSGIDQTLNDLSQRERNMQSAKSVEINPANWEQVLKARANAGDDAALDKYISYLMSEKSLSTAREYESKKNAEAYQTLVADLKKAGINPYWLSAMSSAPSYTSSAQSYTGNQYTTKTKNRMAIYTNLVNGVAKMIGGAGSMFTAIIQAAIESGA